MEDTGTMDIFESSKNLIKEKLYQVRSGQFVIVVHLV